MARCYGIWTELDRIEGKVEEAIRMANTEDLDSLRPFADILLNYKDLLRQNLRKCVAANASVTLNEQVEKIVNIAETHPLLQPSRLDLWLFFKKSEREMAETYSGLQGIAFLGMKSHLESKELAGYFGKNYVLILSVPPLDQETTKILVMMASHVDLFATETENSENIIEDGHAQDETPWHLIDNNRRHVMDNISKMANQVEKTTENQVQFLIKLDENLEEFGCHFSLYGGDTLLMDKLDRFPCSPTLLRIRSSIAPASKATSMSICVEWNYEVLGYPIEFLVEYRPKSNSGGLWTRKKTATPSICIESGPAMEVRVAMDTCIGRSEYSSMLLVPKVRNQRRPNVKSVTQTTAELEWPSQPCYVKNRPFSYRIWYWKNTEDSQIDETDAGLATSYQLKDLTPATSYSVRIVAVSNDGLESSAPSEIVEFSTLKVRFCENVAKECRVLRHDDGLDFLVVPLTKPASCDIDSVDRFVFGVEKDDPKQNKTILFVGEDSSAKSALINSVINYVFNVKINDPFRFQLDVDRRADRTTIYNINHSEGFRTSYSLTTVDTPSIDSEVNPDMSESIRQLFYENCITELDMICLVAQISTPRSISSQLRTFESVLTILGEDVKRNISCVVAVPEVDLANCEIPSRHHKFFDFDFFSSGGNCSRSRGKWQMDMDNLKRFFSDLDAKESTSVSKTQQVLEVRKRLQAALEEVLSLKKAILTKREEVAMNEEMIVKCLDQIYGNHKRRGQVEIARKVDLPSGQYSTICRNCSFTCIETTVKEEPINRYIPMERPVRGDTPVCMFCPENCDWSSHSVEPYKYENISKEPLLMENELMAAEEAVKKLEKDIGVTKVSVLQKEKVVSRCIQELKEIALCPSPLAAEQSIDLWMREANVRLLRQNRHPAILSTCRKTRSLEQQELRPPQNKRHKSS